MAPASASSAIVRGTLISRAPDQPEPQLQDQLNSHAFGVVLTYMKILGTLGELHGLLFNKDSHARFLDYIKGIPGNLKDDIGRLTEVEPHQFIADEYPVIRSYVEILENASYRLPSSEKATVRFLDYLQEIPGNLKDESLGLTEARPNKLNSDDYVDHVVEILHALDSLRGSCADYIRKIPRNLKDESGGVTEGEEAVRKTCSINDLILRLDRSYNIYGERENVAALALTEMQFESSPQSDKDLNDGSTPDERQEIKEEEGDYDGGKRIVDGERDATRLSDETLSISNQEAEDTQALRMEEDEGGFLLKTKKAHSRLGEMALSVKEEESGDFRETEQTSSRVGETTSASSARVRGNSRAAFLRPPRPPNRPVLPRAGTSLAPVQPRTWAEIPKWPRPKKRRSSNEARRAAQARMSSNATPRSASRSSIAAPSSGPMSSNATRRGERDATRLSDETLSISNQEAEDTQALRMEEDEGGFLLKTKKAHSRLGEMALSVKEEESGDFRETEQTSSRVGETTSASSARVRGNSRAAFLRPPRPPNRPVLPRAGTSLAPVQPRTWAEIPKWPRPKKRRSSNEARRAAQARMSSNATPRSASRSSIAAPSSGPMSSNATRRGTRIWPEIPKWPRAWIAADSAAKSTRISSGSAFTWAQPELPKTCQGEDQFKTQLIESELADCRSDRTDQLELSDPGAELDERGIKLDEDQQMAMAKQQVTKNMVAKGHWKSPELSDRRRKRHELTLEDHAAERNEAGTRAGPSDGPALVE